MNGPGHFKKAEDHLNRSSYSGDSDRERYHLTTAQVHATLALAAATAWPVYDAKVAELGARDYEAEGWREVFES